MHNQLETIKIATKVAFKHIYSSPAILQPSKKLKVDRRTNVGNMALAIVETHKLSESERINILRIRKSRHINNQIVNNSLLSNKLFLDYLKHKSSLKEVTGDCLCFHGRNHFAKTESDKIVLSVIKKHFKP